MNVLGLVRKHVGRETKRVTKRITLIKKTPGVRTAGKRTSGTNPGEVPYEKIRAIVTRYHERFVDGTNIRAKDRRILIIAATLPKDVEPDIGDHVIYRGHNFELLTADLDPADAAYLCQGR